MKGGFDSASIDNQHFDPESSPQFEHWTDPESGVTSHVLTTDASPRQKSFHFPNSDVAANGR